MDQKEARVLEKIFSDGTLIPFFKALPYGVIITDPNTVIVFYNDSQARIDSLDAAEVLGKKTNQVYGPHPEPALVAACLKTRQPVIDVVGLYRTLKGKIVSCSHTIFPIMEGGELLGSLCMIVEMKKLVAANKVSPRKLRPDVLTEVNFDTLVGQNLKFLQAVELGRRAALSPSPVMLAAETGCGKEMFARSLHEASAHHEKPFLAVNCAAIPESLLEGTLFGTTRGAFTGAVDRQGLFERVNGGTLFLDELDSMPLDLQPKLLRALQEKSIRRVGSDKETSFDAKIISSVGGNPDMLFSRGLIRPDLFYRLGVVVINIPPLRERLDDVPLLVSYFLMKHNFIIGRRVGQTDPDVLSVFLSYPWPGNVRELEHVIEGALNLVEDEDTLTIKMLPERFQSEWNERIFPKASTHSANGQQGGAEIKSAPDFTQASAHIQSYTAPMNLKETEKKSIHEALTYTHGNISSAARILGLSRQLLTHKVKAHRINRKDYLI